MANIPVSIDRLIRNYPLHDKLPEPLDTFMSHITGTPCCVQVSHALNMAGELVPKTYPGERRDASPITTDGKVYHYVLVVDELETYLTGRYGAGELISTTAPKKLPHRTPLESKAYLEGRTGILLFRSTGYGLHTELWDGHRIVQRGFDETNLFSQYRVLFWDCRGAPQWLDDYVKSLK